MNQEDIENPRNLSKEELEAEKKADEDYIKKLEVAQFKIRGRPELYTKDIQNYSEDFKKFFIVTKEQPLLKNKKFAELAVFLARMASQFKTDLAYVQDYIQEFMEHYAGQMNPFLRKKMVSSYMIMRAQNLILPYKALTFLFKLFNVPDKELRKMVSSHIVNDLKRMNKHHKNEKINKQIQNYIFEILKKNTDILAKRSLQLMIQMYKKSIWNDIKTVNIIAQGCFNDYYKVRLTSCHFLIETTEKIQDIDTSDSDDEEEPVNPKEKIGAKKTKARQQKLEREKKKAAKKQRKKLKQTIQNSFFPIDQIYNPQEFAEKLFSGLRKNSDRFACKLVIMSVIARMINRHKLILISFYSFLQKYLLPHQKEVSKILAMLAESIHELIPYEDIAPIMKQIVDNFVNQRCTEQAMTMGLNTIREMCHKNIFILDKFTLNYLCDYYGYKNRNVSKAAKSIINLYREKNPRLLERKYRGRYSKEHKDLPTTQEEAIPTYTIDKPETTIDGADLIDEGGDVPIYLDRVLTDEDFRKIKFLQQKKKQEEYQKLHNQRYGINSDEEDEDDIDSLGSGESFTASDDEDEDEEQGEGSKFEIEDDENEDNKNQKKQKKNVKINEDGEESPEMSEISELDSGDDLDEQEEEEWASDKEMEDEGDNDDEDDDLEKKIKKSSELTEEQKSEKLKQENKKRRQEQLEKDLEDYDDYESESEGNINPHGFLSEDVIKNFRKKKSERRQEEKEKKAEEVKAKYVHNRKEKGGGTTNKEKLKNKPLQMMMTKKHEIKKKSEKKLNIKSKIKNLKSQLGHVRSKKQFQNRKKQKK